MKDQITAHQLAFEYLRRIPDNLNPAEYLEKLKQLETEFEKLLNTPMKPDREWV